MKREHIFRLRLSDAERADLEQRSRSEGIPKADVIRTALGWEAGGLSRSEASAPQSAPSPTPAPSTGQGPGERGVSALAQRIAERRGS